MVENTDVCVDRVSLHSLSDENSGDVSFEKLDRFLNQVVDMSTEKHSIRPDALIKIIYEGELIVLSNEQADHLLQDPTYSGDSLYDLRNAVERALKGDAAFIHQELMVLIMMAKMTLDKFREDPTIDQIEITRQYPVLERTELEAKQIINEIEEMPSRIEKSRSQHPIISDYESKIGQMIAMQQAADLHSAKRIAMELRSKKKNYLFCCRAMEPDIKGIQFRRLDLQKIKKRLVSMHKYLMAQKIDDIHLEVDSIKKKIRSLSGDNSDSSISSISNDIDKTSDNLNELEKMSLLLQEREGIMLGMEKQNEAYDKDASKTDKVINDIACNVLKTPQAADISDQISTLQSKQKMRPKPNKTDGPKFARMVTINRRK